MCVLSNTVISIAVNNAILLDYFSAVIVGFNASSYTTTEGQPAVLCIQTVIGSVGSTITFVLSTFEVTGIVALH